MWWQHHINKLQRRAFSPKWVQERHLYSPGFQYRQLQPIWAKWQNRPAAANTRVAPAKSLNSKSTNMKEELKLFHWMSQMSKHVTDAHSRTTPQVTHCTIWYTVWFNPWVHQQARLRWTSFLLEWQAEDQWRRSSANRAAEAALYSASVFISYSFNSWTFYIIHFCSQM